MSLHIKICLEKVEGIEIKEASKGTPRVVRVLIGISKNVFAVFQMLLGNTRKVERRRPVPVGLAIHAARYGPQRYHTD